MTAKSMNIIHNGNEIFDYPFLYDSMPINHMVRESSYEAGDVFNIGVQYDWGGQIASRDFSVVVYS